MELIYNWREIVAKAWSVRLIIVAALLSGLEVALPVMREVIEPLGLVPPGVFAGLSFIVTAAAGVARIVAQPKAGL
ncbi:MAG: hypothetical protein PHD99_04780 [Candidatus Moranbacteria bacterium]|nr:hypothetical protein [Candidatus Moranbacteria bacterium]